MNEAWTWRPLRELTIRGAIWNPRADPRPSIRYIDVSAVSRDELRIVSEATYSADNAPSRARKIVEIGDTIFATVRPTLRRIAQIPASLDGEIVSTAFCVLRPDLQAIDADFLYFATQLESVMAGIAAMESGASYPAVRDVDVLDQVVPLPPLPEQREIAAVLNTIRTALLHQARCEVNATALKRAAMKKLFTHGLRGEAQQETEIGPVPESWELVSIGNVFEIEQGLSLKGNLANDGEGTPFLRTSNVYWGRIELKVVSQMRLEGEVPPHKLLRRGDLLVCEGGEIGRAAVWNGEMDECLFQNHLHRLRPVDASRTYPQFAMAWLEEGFTHRNVYEGAGNRTTIPNLSRARLAELLIPHPSPAQQQEIIAILDAIDRKIDLHRRKRAVLDELFKALLHKLMTGEIRVREFDLSTFTDSEIRKQKQ